MSRGAVVVVSGVRQNDGNITNFVLVNCLVAAWAGLLFGYDSGGVISREAFLRKFFPSAFKEREADNENMYCKPHNHLMILFTSSVYIAAMVSALVASPVTRAFGRNISMSISGATYLIGAILSAAAVNAVMLIIGRIFLGIGIGFALQSSIIFLSEMAPAFIRGALNFILQLNVTIGILVANFVNHSAGHIKGGWGGRVSLASAIIPALLLLVGSLFLPDTPNSMLDRGQPADKVKKLLRKIHGTSNVEVEFQDLVFATAAAKKVNSPMKNLLFHPKYRPYLVMCIFIPIFQQLAGINAITFYAPTLYKKLGFGHKASLMSSAITGVVNVVATCVSVAGVDTFGRRPLFLVGGVQMFICQMAVAAMMAIKFGISGHGNMSKSEADFLVILICFYVAAFAWSWGPLGWLVPSEICPLEVRSAAQALNVSVNMLFMFGIAQSSLTMFCHLKFGLFFLFAGFVLIMTVFVFFFVPETKNFRMEDMDRVWREHWFWGRYIPEPQEVSDCEMN
ncbi:hypothetical protein ACFX2H_033574 [Malus domestica]|uniref:sugar transport protein 10-like n=1 Tax=Malus domestica TaxID=3750 RepID=UPI0039762FC6